MSALVACARRYGASRGIAERVATRLTGAGHHVELRPVKEAGDPAGYGAVGDRQCHLSPGDGVRA